MISMLFYNFITILKIQVHFKPFLIAITRERILPSYFSTDKDCRQERSCGLQMDTVQFFSYYTNQNCIVIHPTTAKQVIVQLPHISMYNFQKVKEDDKILFSSTGRDKCNTLYITQVMQPVPAYG